MFREIKSAQLLTIMIFYAAALFVSPQPAKAQFAVYDAINHQTQFAKWIEEGAHWVETIQKYAQDLEYYSNMVEKAVDQVTNLKGILKTVDTTLAKNKDLIFLMNDVGRIVRGSFRLKGELENMVLHRIRALKNIDDRIRNGIFDVDQDKRDFETYLRYTIGRSARDTLSQRVRLAQADTQLAFWLDEKEKLEAQIAAYNELLEEAQNQHEEELNRPPDDQRNIQGLNEVIAHNQKMISDLTGRHAEITALINKRTAQYGVRIQDMENFAHEVSSLSQSWDSVLATHDRISGVLEDLATGN